MVPVGSSVMLELVLAVHSYHVIAYPVYHLISGWQVYDRMSTHPDDEVTAHVSSEVCGDYDDGQKQQNYICA